MKQAGLCAAAPTGKELELLTVNLNLLMAVLLTQKGTPWRNTTENLSLALYGEDGLEHLYP